MLFYDQVDVTVNESGVLAQSASIDSSAELTPIYSVGRKGISAQTPNGPRSYSADISYYVEVDNEPNFAAINNLKTFDSLTEDAPPIYLNIGGISGAFYLSSYQIQAAPNSPIQASVSYVGFTQISGNARGKSGAVDYNLSSGSGIAYGFSAYITTTGTFSVPPKFGFGYSFAAEYKPIYRIGVEEPFSVKLMSANEQMNIVSTGLYMPDFSGSDPIAKLFEANGSTGIRIFGMKFLCNENDDQSLDINISGAKINSSKLGITLDNIITTETTFNKFY